LGRLRVLSGREVCELLAAQGFAEVRRRGSHIAMQKRLPDTTVTVVVPHHKELRMGALASVIRQSRLPRDIFETP
jgi:predicted RNA binding protein YcfA (HicA-like mRNA interferase family)